MKYQAPAWLETFDEQSIRQWVGLNVQKRYQKETIAAAINHAAAAAPTSEDMTGFMMATAEEASLRYSATSTLVLGIIAIFVAFFLGGLSILAIIFAAVSGQRGIKSRTRREQAIAGLVLTGIAVVIFVLSLVLRYVVKL
ncbi:MAG: hypothetical protein QOE92_288 [Chloroflexota bacterium]|jgi:uncharacterized membrane protein|nr:hypothetical protein [Chloroflexota bacterium]